MLMVDTCHSGYAAYMIGQTQAQQMWVIVVCCDAQNNNKLLISGIRKNMKSSTT